MENSNNSLCCLTCFVACKKPSDYQASPFAKQVNRKLLLRHAGSLGQATSIEVELQISSKEAHASMRPVSNFTVCTLKSVKLTRTSSPELLNFGTQMSRTCCPCGPAIENIYFYLSLGLS